MNSTLRIVSLLLCIAAPTQARPRFAVVVGSNESASLKTESRRYSALNYADDDAIKAAQLFRAAGVDTILVTVPDGDTLSRYPEFKGRGLPMPYKHSVLEAIDVQMKKAADAGDADLLFFYSGHGGDGALFLQDSPLTADDLRQYLLVAAEKKAIHRVHLLVDACGRSSESMCQGPRARCDANKFKSGLNLIKHPVGGLMYAMTDDGVTFELPEIQSGVLSYEMLSGLWGAADVGSPLDPSRPDNSVSYKELAAYIYQANRGVASRRAQIQPYTDPPGEDIDDAILDWDPAGAGVNYFSLVMPTERPVRIVITRGSKPRLNRVLETNKGMGPLVLRAPYDGDQYAAIELDHKGKVVGERPIESFARSEMLYDGLPIPKGDIRSDLVTGMFTLPFEASVVLSYLPKREPDGSYFLGFKGKAEVLSNHKEPPVLPALRHESSDSISTRPFNSGPWKAVGYGSGAAASLAVGAYFFFGPRSHAISEAETVCGSRGDPILCSDVKHQQQADDALDRANRYQLAAIAFGITGVALAGVATVQLLSEPNSKRSKPATKATLQIVSGPGGSALDLRGEF